MFSTMVVGARMEFYFQLHQPVFSLNDDTLSLFPISWIVSQPANLLLGLPFSLTLMFILFAHEMGHYLYARRYDVYATPPFFVPFPSLIGTLGAFIRIKSPIPSRAALFDIGIAGPIAGFIPACAALVYGLLHSQPLDHSQGSAVQLGFPLAFYLAANLLHIGVPLSGLSLHPVAARRPARWRPHYIFHHAAMASLDFDVHSLRTRAHGKTHVDGLVFVGCVASLDGAPSASATLSKCHRAATYSGLGRGADAGSQLHPRAVHA